MAGTLNVTFMKKLCTILNYITIMLLVASAILRFIMFGGKNVWPNSNKAQAESEDDEGKADGEDEISRPSDPFFYLLTLYMLPIAFLMVSAELNFDFVLRYIAFLRSQTGKGFFFVFVALLLFDTKYPFDCITSVTMTMVGFFNLILACLVPGLNHLDFLRKDSEEDEGESEEEELVPKEKK